jgi:hypothetical protein
MVAHHILDSAQISNGLIHFSGQRSAGSRERSFGAVSDNNKDGNFFRLLPDTFIQIKSVSCLNTQIFSAGCGKLRYS